MNICLALGFEFLLSKNCLKFISFKRYQGTCCHESQGQSISCYLVSILHVVSFQVSEYLRVTTDCPPGISGESVSRERDEHSTIKISDTLPPSVGVVPQCGNC